ncbi:hypothetical protein B0H19DRAFT_1266632 [Mycena capillaripes]|nr:hypothetical protein B0H19DRAFT_1266632 [Mycena capillaripes]
MDARHHAALARKISGTPATYIHAAGRQSRPGLTALLDLFAAWVDVSGMIELGRSDMFLGHLRLAKVPAFTTVPRNWQLDADFAHLSIVALSGMDRLIHDPRYQSQSHAVWDASLSIQMVFLHLRRARCIRLGAGAYNVPRFHRKALLCTLPV